MSTSIIGLILGSIMLDINAVTNGSMLLSEQSGQVSITLGGTAFNVFCDLEAMGIGPFKFCSKLRDRSFLSKMILSKISDMKLNNVNIELVLDAADSVYLCLRNSNDLSAAISSSSFRNAEIDIKKIESISSDIKFLVIDLNMHRDALCDLLKWAYLKEINTYCLLSNQADVQKLFSINSEILPKYVIGRNKEMIGIAKNMSNFKNSVLVYVSNQNGWKVIEKGKIVFTFSDFDFGGEHKTTGVSGLLTAILIAKQINKLAWDQTSSMYLKFYSLLQKYPGANLLTRDVNETLCYSFFKDELTGLLTRSSLQDNIKMMVEDNGIRNIGMILLDIDHFKKVNDTYGHDIGDKVLQVIARRIKERLRSEDQAYRFGGEEFLCLTTNVTDDVLMSIADRIREEIAAEPITIGETTLNITVSIGISVCDKNHFVFDNLYKETDKKLYLAKRLGRNRTISRVIDLSVA